MNRADERQAVAEQPDEAGGEIEVPGPVIELAVGARLSAKRGIRQKAITPVRGERVGNRRLTVIHRNVNDAIDVPVETMHDLENLKGEQAPQRAGQRGLSDH